LSNEHSAFSKMVQSTGPSNAEYLKVFFYHLDVLEICVLQHKTAFDK
jgi:hypothetical protein